MIDADIPRGWRRINDVCIGTGGGPDASGRDRPEYSVFHHGPRGEWIWEAWHAGKCIAEGLATQAEALDACRSDYRSRKAASTGAAAEGRTEHSAPARSSEPAGRHRRTREGKGGHVPGGGGLFDSGR